MQWLAAVDTWTNRRMGQQCCGNVVCQVRESSCRRLSASHGNEFLRLCSWRPRRIANLQRTGQRHADQDILRSWQARRAVYKLPSAEALEAYLGCVDSFDEIYMMLFSHGVDSIALTPSRSGAAC